MLTGLEAGTYIVRVEQSDGGQVNFCSVDIAAVVSSARIDFCADVSVVGGEEAITITGVRAPWNSIQYRLESSSTYTDICNDNCGNPQVLTGVAAGRYVIRIEQSEGDRNYCVKEIAAIVTSPRRDFCANLSVIGGEETITIAGVHAPWNRIQYRLESSSTYTDICNDNCGNPQVLTGVAAGTYVIRIEQSAGDRDYCVKEIAAIVTSPRRDLCADVQVSTRPYKILIAGVNSAWNRITLTGPSTNHKAVIICEDNCYNPNFTYLVIGNLLPGEYTIVTEESDSDSENYCSVERTVQVSRHLGGLHSDARVIVPTKEATLSLEYSEEVSKRNGATLSLSSETDLKTNIQSTSSINLYPNPVQQSLFINLQAYQGQPAVLRIFNQVGATLVELAIEEITDQPFELNLSQNDFSNGLYFMQAQINGEDMVTEKFVVRK